MGIDYDGGGSGGGGGCGDGNDMTRLRMLHKQQLRDSYRLPTISRTAKSRELF